MPVKNRIAEMHDEIAAWRRDFHEHPELLYDTRRTAAIVAAKLREFGCDEVAEGIGRTGVVGLIRGRSDSGGRVVGIRADMDALPITGGDRPALRLEDTRPHARLRPRRAHRDAARRRQISRRDAQLRRRGGRDLPAGGGGRGGRQGDGRRRPDRPLPHPRDLRHAQLARVCRSALSPSGRARFTLRPTRSPSPSSAAAATRRDRMRRSTRRSSPAISCWRCNRSCRAIQIPCIRWSSRSPASARRPTLIT